MTPVTNGLLADICFYSIGREPIDVVVTNIGYFVNGIITIRRASWTSPCSSSLVDCCACIVVLASEFPMVELSMPFTFPISIAMG